MNFAPVSAATSLPRSTFRPQKTTSKPSFTHLKYFSIFQEILTVLNQRCLISYFGNETSVLVKSFKSTIKYIFLPFYLSFPDTGCSSCDKRYLFHFIFLNYATVKNRKYLNTGLTLGHYSISIDKKDLCLHNN